MKFVKWLAIVVVGFAILAFAAAQLIQWRLLPNSEFANAPPPAPADYSNEDFWFAHPNKQDTSDLIPPNADTSNDITAKPVDVFFIHSTGYVGPGGWNSTMSQEGSETQSLQYMLSSMASAFNSCCEIYAPNYRQAHLAAFADDDTTSSYAALDLAYSDVERAFDYFIANISQGRPFMIVGHSQGSAHGLRLLANRVDNTVLQSRLVAAYTIGYWLPLDMFDRTFTSLGLCENFDDTACIVSYDTYGEAGAMTNGLRHWYPDGWETTPAGNIACVNPLSWEVNTKRVAADAHEGAFPVEFKRNFPEMVLAKNPGFIFDELPKLTPNLLWAKCDESGVLHVPEQLDNAFSNHLNSADKSYHLLDYSLFYGNIRSNAVSRTKAFIQNY